MKNVLITGGAGFVGSHTADGLLRKGYSVKIFDNFAKQVHGKGLPAYLRSDVELLEGDVRDREALARALKGVDAIYHLAAAVGVGQSMYEIASYAETNIQGTANLLQAILDTRSQPHKLIVASSMSIYGEGRYLCASCGISAPPFRDSQQLKVRQWELHCRVCGESMLPIATDEDKALQCTSLYALSKKAQEEMVLLFGRTYDIATVALRYFNIYGPRQSLSNPYTGVAAIFASRLLNNSAPVIFEDGLQTRDFVSVHDVVQANLLALHSAGADGAAVNVGTGAPVTILEIAQRIARMLGREIEPRLSGIYRAGDVRHCYADTSRLSKRLGFAARITLQDGIAELVDWLASQQADDLTDDALQQLAARGLAA